MQRCCAALLTRRRLLLYSSATVTTGVKQISSSSTPITFRRYQTIRSPFPQRPEALNTELFGPRCSSPFYPPRLNLTVRHFATKERSRAPATPVKSKVKKYKLKSYSSFKFRFRTMNDGQIRRWRAGKRHNAHLKSKKSSGGSAGLKSFIQLLQR